MFSSAGDVSRKGQGSAIRSIALISNTAFTLRNFRGPLILDLARQGVRVYAMAPDFDDEARGALAALGADPIDISLDRAGMRPFRDFLDLLRLASQLRRLSPDATFSYFAKPVIYGSVAARLAGIRRRYALVAGLGYVFTAGSEKTFKRRLLRRTVLKLYQWAFDSCERIFFQNSDDIAYFSEAGVLQPEKAVRVNGTGVELDRFAFSPRVPTTPMVFLLMARLLRQKGICEFAFAARRIKKRHPEARFILLGGLDENPDGLTRGEIEGWVKEGTIEWFGHVDDVRPWLVQSSVYVLPSYYREGIPRSIQEAMAVGRAVITADTVGCRETVEDGLNGYLVPARDADALVEAMSRFMGDPELVRQMGRASRRIAEERFDVRRINRLMLAEMGVSQEGGTGGPEGLARKDSCTRVDRASAIEERPGKNSVSNAQEDKAAGLSPR